MKQDIMYWAVNWVSQISDNAEGYIMAVNNYDIVMCEF